MNAFFLFIIFELYQGYTNKSFQRFAATILSIKPKIIVLKNKYHEIKTILFLVFVSFVTMNCSKSDDIEKIKHDNYTNTNLKGQGGDDFCTLVEITHPV
jgi:hypothetical protein